MNEPSEWDIEKAKSNAEKHGLTFESAEQVFDDEFALEKYDDKNSTLDEARYITIGRIKSQIIVVVVHTSRNGKTRIISARYANSRERRFYYDQFTN